LLGINYQQFFI